MWVIIEFNRLNDQQNNHTLIRTQEGLMNFVNTILSSSSYTHAKLVMIPPSDTFPQKKMYPLITSDTCDFYAQWFNFPID